VQGDGREWERRDSVKETFWGGELGASRKSGGGELT